MNKCKKFISITLFTLVFLFLTGTGHAVPTVSLDVSSTDIHTGDPFTIDVIIDGVTDIDAFMGPDMILAFSFDVDYTDRNLTITAPRSALHFLTTPGFLSEQRWLVLLIPLERRWMEIIFF